jgi:hypothetical protein
MGRSSHTIDSFWAGHNRRQLRRGAAPTGERGLTGTDIPFERAFASASTTSQRIRWAATRRRVHIPREGQSVCPQSAMRRMPGKPPSSDAASGLRFHPSRQPASISVPLGRSLPGSRARGKLSVVRRITTEQTTLMSVGGETGKYTRARFYDSVSRNGDEVKWLFSGNLERECWVSGSSWIRIEQIRQVLKAIRNADQRHGSRSQSTIIQFQQDVPCEHEVAEDAKFQS